MSVDKKLYHSYTVDLERATNKIQLPKSVRTNRKGFRGVRDKAVFFMQSWVAAERWAGLPKAVVYWLALTPLAITSFNGFVSLIGLSSLSIPLEYGSILAILLVTSFMVFGMLAWTRLGLNRRSSELGGKQNPNYFLLYSKLCDLEKEIKELKKK